MLGLLLNKERILRRYIPSFFVYNNNADTRMLILTFTLLKDKIDIVGK